MSYARFSEGDIYVYPSSSGYTCAWCNLIPPAQGRWVWEPESVPLHDVPADFNCGTLEELKLHVLEHIRVGDDVPFRCLEQIKEELGETSCDDT